MGGGGCWGVGDQFRVGLLVLYIVIMWQMVLLVKKVQYWMFKLDLWLILFFIFILYIVVEEEIEVQRVKSFDKI